MGIYIRPDSVYYQLRLDGHTTPAGRPLTEATDIRHDAPTPVQRKENRELALVRYHARLTELAGGKPVDAEAKPTILLFPFLDWWTTHKLPKRRGHERDAAALPLLRAFFKNVPLATIDEARTAEYQTWRLETVQPRTINREVQVLKAVLKAAAPKYLAKSPIYGMKELKAKTPRRHLTTTEEEAKLLAVMDPDDKALYLLASDSLVRLTDCLDVKTTDLNGATVYIEDPKANGGFTARLSDRALAALAAMPRGVMPGGYHLTAGDVTAILTRLEAGESKVALAREFKVSQPLIRTLAAGPLPPSVYLFPRRRRAQTERDRRSGVRQMLERYCRLAGLAYGRAVNGLQWHHATRRTGATRMLTRGHDIGTVQKIGRWKKPDVVLGIYHELIDEKVIAAVNAVAPEPPAAPPAGVPLVGKPPIASVRLGVRSLKLVKNIEQKAR